MHLVSLHFKKERDNENSKQSRLMKENQQSTSMLFATSCVVRSAMACDNHRIFIRHTDERPISPKEFTRRAREGAITRRTHE